MKQLAVRVVGMPILNIETGRICGHINALFIDVRNNKVALFRINPRFKSKFTYLIARDAREINDHYVVVNSENDLSEPDELIKYKPVIEIPIQLIKAKVKTQSGRYLGRCRDFCFDGVSFDVVQIYITGPFWQKIITSNHIIDGRDIISINQKQIIVKDSLVKSAQKAKSALSAHTS